MLRYTFRLLLQQSRNSKRKRRIFHAAAGEHTTVAAVTLPQTVVF
jgi:hypothetical protein